MKFKDEVFELISNKYKKYNIKRFDIYGDSLGKNIIIEIETDERFIFKKKIQSVLTDISDLIPISLDYDIDIFIFKVNKSGRKKVGVAGQRNATVDVIVPLERVGIKVDIE